MKLSPSTLHFCLTSIRNKKLAIATFTALSLLGWSSDASAATQYWNQAGTTGTWNTGVWGSSAGGPFTGAWVAGSDAYFGANSTGTYANTNNEIGNVTVADNATVTMTAGGSVRNSAATSYISTYDIGTGATLNWTAQSQYITGATTYATSGFIKNGAGTWNIGAQSAAYTGGFTLNAGTIIITGANSVGTGTFKINGGVVSASGTTTRTAPIVLGGDFTNAGTGTQTWSGTVALGSATRTINNTTTSGSRSYTGVISGADGSGLTFSGAGTGQTYIGNTANTFSGPVAITGGEVIFNNNGAFGNSTSITLDGGRLTIGSSSSGATITTATIATTRNIFVGSTAGTSLSIGGSTGVTTYSGVIADKLGSTGLLAKQGAGALVLGGVSTYSGATSINNGTVKLTIGNNRLPTGTVVSIGQASSSNLGTLDLNGQNQQIAGLVSTTGTVASGTVKNTVTSTAAATLDINVAAGATSSYGAGTAANSGAITGAISLKKSGLGTQTLGDTNTYTGATTVDAGKLVINGSISTSTTTVNSTGTLTGSGTVGAVTVKSGGFIAPGNSPGTLNTGNITLEAGSSLGIEIDGATVGTQYDRLNVTGSVSLAGLLSMTMSGSYAPANGSLFFILANDGADAITGTFSNASVNGGTYTLGGQKFQISYAGDTVTSSFTGGNDVVLQAVPEPASLLLGAVAILTLLRRRR
jgi:autotransporter-associated beta strand protein